MITLLAVTAELDNNSVALGVLGVFVALIGQHFVLRRYIRDAAGVKESNTTVLDGQPIQVALAKEFTTRDSFHKHAQLNREHHEKIESRVAALERKLEDDKDEIIASGEDRANRIAERVNVAIEKIGELRGRVEEIAKRV